MQYTKEELVGMCKRAAVENNGRPIGGDEFFRRNGISIVSLHDVGIRSYGELCIQTGLVPNRLKGRLDPDLVFCALAGLTIKIEKFPNKTDREMARRHDRNIPSYEAVRTLESKDGRLDIQLLAWCECHPEFDAAIKILKKHIDENPIYRPRIPRMVCGYVYLAKYGNSGREYKIGRSVNAGRRIRQIDKMNPKDVNEVHRIQTDDPEGIEKYWHRRFSENIVPGKTEIFRLDAEDVSAFKWRKYQ